MVKSICGTRGFSKNLMRIKWWGQEMKRPVKENKTNKSKRRLYKEKLYRKDKQSKEGN